MMWMRIKLSSAGKRFNRDWIFRNADLEFDASSTYAITGANGSGKSTLLQSIAGILQLSEGTISYSTGNKTIPPEKIYSHVSFCAPYQEMIEEFSLIEFLQFHSRFKNFIDGMPVQRIIEAVQLKAAAHKQIRYYSSGMKQRVKLAQAFFSDTSLLLLDEPCSNLDAEGIALYHELIEKFGRGRLVIVSSNDPEEYRFCTNRINVQQLKQIPVRPGN